MMATLATKCATCGLRIQNTTVGWQHLSTAAGRKAQADHAATPRWSEHAYGYGIDTNPVKTLKEEL